MKRTNKTRRSTVYLSVALTLAISLPMVVAAAECYWNDVNNGYCGPAGWRATGGTGCIITTCDTDWGCTGGYKYLQCSANPYTATCTTAIGVIGYTPILHIAYCVPLGPGPSVPGGTCHSLSTLGCT